MALPSLAAAPAGARVLMIESRFAFTMVPYHKRRLTFLISAMRHFAEELKAAGLAVDYYPLKSSKYRDSLSALRDHAKKTKTKEIWITAPTEYHTKAWLDTLAGTLGEELGFTFHFFDNTLFLTNRESFTAWATQSKTLLMETFYRGMRERHNILLDHGKPAGGKWNLDHDNRKPFKATVAVPPLPAFGPDDITRAAMADVEREFAAHPGNTAGFDLPVTRADAEAALADFLEHRLPLFGAYEDAMASAEPILFHSHLSSLLNAGLLDPLRVVRAAEQRYRDGLAPLNSVEGFCRQIIGWREFVYGIYWAFMPGYRDRNPRQSTRSLPQFFWDGKTDMNCLRHALGGVVERAYSHHIQRLMVICNFATLAGLRPQDVNDWFLAMYIDSHDWVVTPNVIGMAMNSDGNPNAPRGVIATKPYVSSAAYINRMSDYCKGCRYDHAARVGDDACPFNYLYWTFLQHYRDVFLQNQRMVMMVKNLDRIPAEQMKEMMTLRKTFIESLPTY